MSERIEDEWGSARARMFPAQVSLAKGDNTAARSRLDKAMDAHRRLGDREDAALCLELYASALLLDGAAEEAAIILGASDSLRRSVVPTFSPDNLERVGARELRKDLGARLGEREVNRLRERGRLMTWAEAVGLVASSTPAGGSV